MVIPEKYGSSSLGMLGMALAFTGEHVLGLPRSY
ncbi:hypothetical protein CW703_04210 [Candidatus Bathyarchaeota archaeon]|nr:MAG: hypothetical protein CW703_04210 [Candidatus Bathyarchaeota archaeon]